MKINNIILYNFGSYEGLTNFETAPKDDKNIVLIGGKNGAGKTTLFTAIRLCLYGYMSMGYKNYNSFYSRAITKLINNTAKISRPTEAFVKLNIELNNGQGVDYYTLSRKWTLTDSINEKFIVEKNGVELNDNELADFEKFILSLIPPELFNLYFFDGEKIADFFLEEGSNARLKDAFLILCGYDTFDIMRRNFKRISTGVAATPGLSEYLIAKQQLSAAEKEYFDTNARLQACIAEIYDCESTIDAQEKEYYQKGGITEEEWNEKLFILKDEEKKRENYNSLLKKWANDIIPFIMIRKQVENLKRQIDDENKTMKYRCFCEIVESPEIRNLIQNKLAEIKKTASETFLGESEPILDLSFEQSSLLLAQINQILSFEIAKVERCKKAIKKSLNLTAKIRKDIDNSSVATVQDYMKNRAKLFEEKSMLLVQRVELEKAVSEQKELVEQAKLNLHKVQNRLEDELKKASINDISARAIIMLDKLQDVLYRRQIEKVENFFRKEINTLMRKTHFIDDIYIDNNFNTHIYRTDDITVSKMHDFISTNSEEQFISVFGRKALEILKDIAKTTEYVKMKKFFKTYTKESIRLPIEIDKLSLSNGEKQIFIMALYHSLVRLCKNELPFIIDTPFARIDTEHRHNISKHFFSKLNGQVFVLSTNEEINSAHVKILNKKIVATYMLENADNKKTVVVKNSYFEV